LRYGYPVNYCSLRRLYLFDHRGSAAERKAADLAGAFGGMARRPVFGPRGSATVLSKATTIAAILFMFTSLSLSIIATRGTKGGSSVLDKPSRRRRNKGRDAAARLRRAL